MKRKRELQSKAFPDAAEIEKALAKAVRKALIFHKKMGQPIAVWKDGKPTWIPSEEIDVEAVAVGKNA